MKWVKMNWSIIQLIAPHSFALRPTSFIFKQVDLSVTPKAQYLKHMNPTVRLWITRSSSLIVATSLGKLFQDMQEESSESRVRNKISSNTNDHCWVLSRKATIFIGRIQTPVIIALIDLDSSKPSWIVYIVVEQFQRRSQILLLFMKWLYLRIFKEFRNR